MAVTAPTLTRAVTETVTVTVTQARGGELAHCWQIPLRRGAKFS